MTCDLYSKGSILNLHAPLRNPEFPSSQHLIYITLYWFLCRIVEEIETKVRSGWKGGVLDYLPRCTLPI